MANSNGRLNIIPTCIYIPWSAGPDGQETPAETEQMLGGSLSKSCNLLAMKALCIRE